MDLRRLLVALGAGTLGLVTSTVALPSSAQAAFTAPKTLTVNRTADDAYKLRVVWQAVPEADHYTIDIGAGDVRTVLDLPATTTEYFIDAPNPCTPYKIRVGAVDYIGAVANTGYYSLRALTPSAVTGVVTSRTDDGTTANATWKLPAWGGYAPLTGYRAVLTRMIDGAVLTDRTGTDMSFRYPGIDPERAYTLSLTTINQYGACVTTKSLVERFRPAEPMNVVAERRADTPGTVEMVWKAPTVGPVPTYYQIGYGNGSVTRMVKVDASARSASLDLAPDKSWVVELRAFNDNGGSTPVTTAIPATVFETPAAPAPVTTTDAPAAPAPETTTTAPATDTTTGTPGAPAPETTTDAPAAPAPDSTTDAPAAPATDKTSGIPAAPAPDTTTDAPAAPPSDTTTEAPAAPAPSTATDSPATPAPGTTTDSPAAPVPDPTTAAPEPTLAPTGDQTPPTISAGLSVVPVDDWFRDPVMIQFTCDDDTGPVFCPSAMVAATDGLDQRYTGTARDAAGNTATITVALRIDRTAPEITATVIGTPNVAGWYTTPPTIHFTCSDALSGIASCPADTVAGEEGPGQQITGTAVDKAGNIATATVVLDIDGTVPTVSTSIDQSPNAAGWYRTSPTVHFDCADAASGVGSCTADTTVDTDGAGQVVRGTVADLAGNTATTSVKVDVDRTAPAIRTVVDQPANANGWYRTTPTVSFVCSDQGSGIDVCPAAATVDTDGAGQVLDGTATDRAGNTATASVKVDVDRTAPGITAALIGETNQAGWHRTPPTIHFTCTDTGSGIDVCPADTTVDTDGAAQVVTGTAVDKAGNTATTSVTVDLDRTVPVITTSIDAAANTAGWYRTVPTVSFTCTDTGSGVGTCPDATTVTAQGADRAVTGTATDRAGNTAVAEATLNVDRTAPKITAALTGTANAAGWYRTAPVVTYTCTDDISGIATCPADTTVRADGVQTVVGTAVDKADNTAGASVTVKVDRTAPVVSVAGAVDGGAYGPDAAPVVSCATTDPVSGVATAAVLKHTENSGTHTVRCTGAVDKAGNAAAAVEITYSVKLNAAWLAQLTRKYAGSAPAVTLQQLENDLYAGRIMAYIAKVTAMTKGAKPVLTPVQATTLTFWALSLVLTR